MWIVDEVDDDLKLCLVPNSGFIKHPNNNYPAHTEDLDILDDVTNDDNWKYLGNIDDNPELLKGLNFKK